jgi:Coenzyme PQQ synthesis protein D (PqqD)
MLAENHHLVPNEQDTVSKVLDGEAVIINLSNGVYYSMSKVGGFVWERIMAAQSLQHIITAVTEQYDVSRDQAATDVRNLIEQLLEERLIMVSDPESRDAEPLATPVGERSAYAAPKLEIFRDIGHLVALDPPMPGLKDVPWKGPADESSR